MIRITRFGSDWAEPGDALIDAAIASAASHISPLPGDLRRIPSMLYSPFVNYLRLLMAASSIRTLNRTHREVTVNSPIEFVATPRTALGSWNNRHYRSRTRSPPQ